jgi:MtaA/CmuA family methyltransferase
MTSKERFFAALLGKPVDRVPVFPLLMFFAAERAGLTYRQFATSGSALAEAQLGILERFPIDALTVCSDAFRVSADLGGEMAYPENTPPHLTRPLVRSRADLLALRRPDPLKPGSRMADRALAAGELARAVGDRCAVLGWVDMPFAEACSACGVSEFMMMLVDEPAMARELLEFLTAVVIDFALAQLAAGAPMIGAGDAAASLISPEMYRDFALPYERRVCEAIHAVGGTVKLHVCGNTSALLEDMAGCGADLFNLDHMVDFAHALAVYGRAGKCFKGNLNPVSDMLHATPVQCRRRALECLAMAKGKAYMLSPGCEMPPGVSDETFMAFCRAPFNCQL